jgi:hypothetical protein
MTAARLSARQFLQGPRKWLLLLAGAVYPAMLSLFVFVEKQGLIHPFLQLFDQLYLQGVVLFIALLGAVPAFSSDVEDGTIVYLFSRPTWRPFVVIGKWLGCMVPLTIITLVPVLAAWPLGLRQVQPYESLVWKADAPAKDMEQAGKRRPGNAEAPSGTWVKEMKPSQRQPVKAREVVSALAATAVGAVMYGTLFYCMGVILKWPYMLSLAYGVIFELSVGRAPVRIFVISRFVRSVAIRTLEPVPRFWEADLEYLPDAWLTWIGVPLIPAVLLGAAALLSVRKAYIGRGI